MSDVFTKSKRSEVMSRIRSRGNKDTELALARLLRAHKITGWRRHALIAVEGRKSKVEGKTHSGARPSSLGSRLTVRPDFVFLKPKLAIFVDGCFWHGCPNHATKPKNNRAFWRRKLASNKKRDQVVNRTLRGAGWRVIRIWEHELPRLKAKGQTLKGKQSRVVRRIQRAL